MKVTRTILMRNLAAGLVLLAVFAAGCADRLLEGGNGSFVIESRPHPGQ